MPQPTHMLKLEVTFRETDGGSGTKLRWKTLLFDASEIKVTTSTIIIYDEQGIVLAVYPIDVIKGVQRLALVDFELTR